MRTVLIVTGVYPPCNVNIPSAKRIEGFVRYLSEYGWQCILLVEACHCAEVGYDQRDEIWLSSHLIEYSKIIERIKTRINKKKYPLIIRVPCSPKLFYKVWMHLAKLTGFKYESKEAEFENFHYIFPLPNIHNDNFKKISIFLVPLRKLLSLFMQLLNRNWQGQTNWLKHGSKIGKILSDSINADVVLGSSPAVENLELASIISQKMHIPWIADIRDSINRGWSENWRTELDILKTKEYLKNVSNFIHVTRQEAERDKKLLKNGSFIIENGFFEEEMEQAKISAKDHISLRFTIRFLGSIYAQRNLDLFLEGFKYLIESEQLTNDNIIFEYYGWSWREMEQSVSKYNIQNFCRINKPVQHTEAFFLTVSATTLVLPTNNLGQSGIPGSKFYEYLGVERPILSVGGKDAYVEDVLRKTGAGIMCYSKEDVFNTLKTWFYQWKQSGKLELQINHDEIKKFSRRHSAKKLANILDAIVDGKEITQDEFEKL